jgi:hypothetical protein
MATGDEESGKWLKIGETTTTPSGEPKGTDVEIDDCYVVVGFEVNQPAAFLNDVHDLYVDYGHAFFYVVKNALIETHYSFGPGGGAGKVGWLDRGNLEGTALANRGALLKNGEMNTRLGTADYPIKEDVSAFKIQLTPAVGAVLIEETTTRRQEVKSGKRPYIAYMNDTCASEARELLSAAGVNTPEGAGVVKHSGFGLATSVFIDLPIGSRRFGFTAVNPYMWHKNFEASEYPSAKYGGAMYWVPAAGAADPIF